MSLYAVIPLATVSGKGNDLIKELTELDAYSDCAPHIWFVNYDDTSKKLSERLGFNSDKKARGIIIKISRGYFGYGKRDMWEWLESRENDG